MDRVEANDGTVTHDELLMAGVSREQLKRLRASGRIVPLHRGVFRIAGAPDSYDAQVRAAMRHFLDEGLAWAAFFTAARLWGLGLEGPDPRIELLRPWGTNSTRAGVLVRRSRLILPHHVTFVRGIPVATPSRTLMDLARLVGPARLARAVTVAITDTTVPCSLASLWVVLYDLGGRGRPGTRRMRADLEARDVDEPPTESVLDEIGRALLRCVPGIRWQVEISDERGYIRRVDALVPDARLVIELDSKYHDDPVQRDLDAHNDRRLAAMGYRTRRFRWDDVTRRGDLTLAEVLDAVDRAAA